MAVRAARDSYWWASEDPADIVGELQPKEDAAWSRTGMMQAAYRNSYIYYSSIIEANDWSTGLVFTGNQGELIKMLVPKARSLIRQLIMLQTKERLVFNPICDTTKTETLEAARLGKSVCRSIVRSQKMNAVFAQALENHYLTGLGFLYSIWRTDRGSPFGLDDQGVMHYTGEVEITAPTIWDLRFDGQIDNPQGWNWVRVRQKHNRWDLIAQFPQLRDQLLQLPSVNQSGRLLSGYDSLACDQDLVYIYAAYHRVTPAMPEGRMIVFGDRETIMVDMSNPYKKLPLFVCRNEPIPNSSYGYPFFSQLVPLQEMYDSTMSSIATAIDTFGVQMVVAPSGANVNPMQLFGMNWLEYDPVPGTANGGKPEALQLTQVSEHSYKFKQLIDGDLMEISNIVSAMRGNPPEGVTSGTAFATLTATALETIHATGIGSRDMLRDAMMQAIENYKIFGSAERSVPMGAGRGSYSKTFTGSDLDPIRELEMTEINPLMQTISGRESVADKLIQMGVIRDQKAYFQVLEGAPPEILYELELSQEDLVRVENEMMMRGEPAVVIATDVDPHHVMLHTIQMNSQRVRNDPTLLKLHTDHIAEHLQSALTKSPILAAMIATGQMPQLPPPGAEPAGGGAPQAVSQGPSNQQPKGVSEPSKPQKDPVARSA